MIRDWKRWYTGFRQLSKCKSPLTSLKLLNPAQENGVGEEGVIVRLQ